MAIPNKIEDGGIPRPFSVLERRLRAYTVRGDGMKRWMYIILAALVLVTVCAGARETDRQDTAGEVLAVDNAESVEEAEENVKYVALTFDDGP